MLSKFILCIFCISLFLCTITYAQKVDSISKVTLRQKKQRKIPQTKSANYTPPERLAELPNNPIVTDFNTPKQGRILTVYKVYPNPVSEQINISLRLEREAVMSIKILDLLGNEIISLMNEKMAAGEYNKSYTLPKRLNTGIYFLRIVAAGEPVVKRISVL